MHAPPMASLQHLRQLKSHAAHKARQHSNRNATEQRHWGTTAALPGRTPVRARRRAGTAAGGARRTPRSASAAPPRSAGPAAGVAPARHSATSALKTHHWAETGTARHDRTPLLAFVDGSLTARASGHLSWACKLLRRRNLPDPDDIDDDDDMTTTMTLKVSTTYSREKAVSRGAPRC